MTDRPTTPGCDPVTGAWLGTREGLLAEMDRIARETPRTYTGSEPDWEAQVEAAAERWDVSRDAEDPWYMDRAGNDGGAW